MAKIDMFDGKVNNISNDEKKLNTWYDSLIGCPSQCYYYFLYQGEMYCIYLRWRHRDPWTAEIINCAVSDFDLDPDTSIWKYIKIPFFEENELEELKGFVMTRLAIITTLWPYAERDISLHVEEYRALPPDVCESVAQMTTKLVEENKTQERKIKTWHAGEIKGFDMYLQMEVRDYIARHNGELIPEDGVYVNPDTADIIVTTIDKVTDRQNFYPFTSLVEYDSENGKYYVNKDATGDVAFTYYEYL